MLQMTNIPGPNITPLVDATNEAAVTGRLYFCHVNAHVMHVTKSNATIGLVLSRWRRVFLSYLST